MKIHFGSNSDRDKEQETSDTSDEEDGDLELKEDSLSDSIGLSELEGSDGEVEDHDGFEKFRWLKSINILINADDAAVSPQVGFCEAKLTDRDSNRASFHHYMEEPSNDTARLLQRLQQMGLPQVQHIDSSYQKRNKSMAARAE